MKQKIKNNEQGQLSDFFHSSTNTENFSIFDSSNKDYLNLNELDSWMSTIEPMLENMPKHMLLAIFRGLGELELYDRNFVRKLSDSTIKVLSEFSYSQHADILYSLVKMKHNKDIKFIKAIVDHIPKSIDSDEIKSLSKSIWALSKL